MSTACECKGEREQEGKNRAMGGVLTRHARKKVWRRWGWEGKKGADWKGWEKNSPGCQEEKAGKKEGESKV